jgi:O-antigen/teichoic acid export membrane protein
MTPAASMSDTDARPAPAPPAGRRLALYAVAYAGSAAFHKGLGFVVFMWLASQLPMAGYAAFGLLYALLSGVGALALAGIVEAVIGLLPEHRSAAERRRLFAAAGGVFAALAAASAAVVAIGGWAFLRGSVTAPALAAATLAGLLTAFFSLQAQLTRLEEDHRASLLLSFVPPVAGLAGGCSVFLATGSVDGFFAGFALAMLGTWLVVCTRRRRVPAGAALRDDRHAIAARLAPFVLVALLGWLAGYGNTWIVQAFFTAEDVARFTFIYTLSSVMQLVATSLNQVWSPRVFRRLQDRPVAEVDAGSRRFFTVQGLALGAVGAALLVAAPLAVGLATGRLAAYRDLEAELLLLLVAYAVSIPWYHVQNYYLAFGRGRQLMHVSLVSSAVGLVLWVAAMVLLGTIGVYAGFALMMATRMAAAVWWARREWGVGLMWQGPALALLLLLAGGAAAKALAG